MRMNTRVEQRKNIPELMTLEEATRYFRTSRPTLLKALRNGELDGFKVGRVWRISKDPPKEGLKSASSVSKMNSLQKAPSCKR